MLQALDQADIPNEQISGYTVQLTNDGQNPSEEEIERIQAKAERMEIAMEPIRNKGQPIVFINGHARAQPSAATVIASYPLLTAK